MATINAVQLGLKTTCIKVLGRGRFFKSIFLVKVYFKRGDPLDLRGSSISLCSEESMARMPRSYLQSLLKLVNSVIGLTGMGMILYALWMLRAWFKQIGGGGGFDSSPPWFIYTFLGLGVFLFLLTCSGHIAAETANDHVFPDQPDVKVSNKEGCTNFGLPSLINEGQWRTRFYKWCGRN